MVSKILPHNLSYLQCFSDEEIDEDSRSDGSGSGGEISGGEEEKEEDESESEVEQPSRKDTAIEEQRVVFLR